MTYRRRQLGISLIEALVALAVMALGMLGMVGLQATMRMNADIAKQRAEATRLAQERIESMRSYGSLLEFSAGVADVAAGPAAGPSVTNTTYTITTQVTPDVLPANAPPLREAVVTVTWEDRASQPQSVVLATQVVGVAPALTGGLSTPSYGNPARRIFGRNAAIPQSAVNQGNGTSKFTVPNGGGAAWVFNNVTGLIKQVCNAAGTCASANSALVSGVINFALDLNPQTFTPSVSETPPGPSINVLARVIATSPNVTVTCFMDKKSLWTLYYCAVPLDATDFPNFWSGRVELVDGWGDLDIANDSSDDHDNRHRVCRYTPTDTDVDGAVANPDHPRNYIKVTGSLANQNFLVISAASHSHKPYTCPDDGPSEFVNSNTYAHQPTASP